MNYCLDKIRKLYRSLRSVVGKVVNVETLYTLYALFSNRVGVSDESSSENEFIISLTSIPSRMNKLHVVIESLLRQTVKPSRIVLWLSEYDRNGNRILDKEKIPFLLRRQIKRGLEISYCDDIRSYRKLLPTLQKYPGANVITADDDIIYPKDWFELLYAAHLRFPECVACYRGVKIGFDVDGRLLPYSDWPESEDNMDPRFDIFPQGCGGIMYPKGIFNEELFNKDVFMDICLTADDIWFKAMSLHNCRKVIKLNKIHRDFPCIRESQNPNETLHYVNNTLGQNDVQISKVFERYNLPEHLKSKSHKE